MIIMIIMIILNDNNDSSPVPPRCSLLGVRAVLVVSMEHLVLQRLCDGEEAGYL